MLALVDHEPVVAGGEGGVDAAGGVGGHEQGLAQRGVAGFGGWAVVAAGAGGGQRGDQAGEGAGSGEGLEPGGVAEAGQDLGAVDEADAGHGGHDGGRVGLVEQAGELGVQVTDLGAEGEGQAGLGGDVLGQIGVGQLAVPQLQRLGWRRRAAGWRAHRPRRRGSSAR